MNNPKPFVSICTPTFNRRPFIPFIIKCFENQDYPKDRIEWIIIDDGTDKVEDIFTNVPQVKYFKYNEKMSLGKKRNIANQKSIGDFIIYMDDDDYYPPTRISHAVEMLQNNPDKLCAGSSEMFLFFKHIQKMYKFGPYGPNHATAATFAFRKELLTQTSFKDDVALAEEKIFLKNYTIPFVQLDTMKTILVFSHIQNSFDKKILLKDLPTPFITESNKTVDDFIVNENEREIKHFFMEDIDALLNAYEPGNPNNKIDVMTQLDAIQKHRTQVANQQKQYMDILKKLNINPNDSLVQKNNQTLINPEVKINEMSMVINELLLENNLLKDKANYFENKMKQLISSQIEERKKIKFSEPLTLKV
jgi:glycosyltransferase involved in cell wall biosynthesis